jgi:DNA-binding IclR family transcriptional regulator
MGMRLPAHVTSVGKTLLANLTEKELNNYFTTTKELKKYTKNTITDIENLKEYLKQVREQGYALDNEEVEEGLVCVAAPIFDLNKRAIAAISISGPEFRMKPDFQKYIPHAKDTAAAISRQIGYRN